MKLIVSSTRVSLLLLVLYIQNCIAQRCAAGQKRTIWHQPCEFRDGSQISFIRECDGQKITPTERVCDESKCCENHYCCEGDATSVTSSPQRAPTPKPTKKPTPKPTPAPVRPTPNPTKKPTPGPTPAPTPKPTRFPTKLPTNSPSTTEPTVSPTTLSPTPAPTASPTESPTTQSPTLVPTQSPTKLPTSRSPTNSPTKSPQFEKLDDVIPSGDQSCSLNRCRTNTTGRVTLVNRNWAIDAAKRRCATPASSDCIPCPEGAHATRRSSWQPCLPCGESPFGKFQLVRDGSVYCTGSVVKSRSEDLCTYRRSILLGTEQSQLNLPSQTFGFPSRKVAEILMRDAQASCGFLQTDDSNFITSVGRFSISIFSTFVRNSGELPIILHEWTAPPWIRPTGELIGFPNLLLKGGEQRELVFLVVGSSTPLPVTGDEEVEISDLIEFDVMQLFPNPGVDAATPFRTSIPVRISVYFEGIALMPSAVEYSATSTGTPIEFTLTLLSPSTRNSYNTFFSVTRSTFNGIPTDNSDWLSVAANDGNELDSSTCGDSSAAVDNAFSIVPADFAPGYYEAIIEVTASRRTDGDEIVPLTVETAFTVVSLHITNGGPMIPSQTAFVIGEESDSFTDTNTFVRKLNDEDVEIPINQIAIQILPRDVNGYNTSVPTQGTGDGESIEFVVEWQLLSNLTEVFGSTRVTVNGGVWKTYLDVSQIGMYSIKVLTQDSTNNLVQIAGSPRHIQVTPQECTGEHEVPAPGNGKGCTCAAGYGVLASSQSDSSQRCKRCPSGTYSSEGLVVCLPCPEGTIQPNSGASSCTACGPGTEEFRGTTCVPCSVNRVSDAGTGFKCEPCGVRQVAIGNQCYCDPNYYLDPTVVDDSSCVKCPVGAYCAFATVDTLIALDGYWQVEWDKTKFLKCTPASACRGVKGPVENLIADMTLIVQNTAPTGRPINKRMLSDTSRSHDTSTSQSLIHQHNSMPHSRKLESITANSVVAPESTLFATVNLTQGCEVGFEGKFCGECSHGFFPALNSECKKCSSATDTLVTMVLSVIAFLLFFVALVYHSLSSKNAGHTDVAVTLLKQFASHLQVLGMAQSLRTTWPDWMKQAFEFFTSMSDAGSLDLHCVSFHVSGSEPGEGGMKFLDRYYNAAVGFMLAPPVVALLAYVFWTIKHSKIVTSCISKLKRTTSARDSNRNVLDTDATKVQDVNNSLLRNPVVVCVVVTLTVLLFLWQPFLTRIGLSFFACEEKLEDRYFLRTALSVECGSEKHGSVIWVGFAISFIYALGIPLLVLLVLFGAVVQRWPWPLTWNVDHEKDRKQLASNHVLAYKFLHRSFKPRYFYWESLVVIRKTAFAVTAVVLSSLEQQVLLGSVVTMIGIGLQIRFSPYKDTRDAQQYGGEGVTKRRGMLFHRWMRATLDLNRIEVVSLSLILGTFWSALFIAEFEQETTVTVILSVIIIILNIAFFVQILLCLVYEAFNIRKAIRLAKTKPEETIENGNRSNLVKDKKVVQHERLPPPSINEGGVTRLSRVASDTSVVADSVTWHVHDSDDDVGQDPVSQHVSIA